MGWPGGGDGHDAVHRGSNELIDKREELEEEQDDFQDLIPVANDQQQNQAEQVRDARQEQELTQEDVSAERRQFTAAGAPPPPGMRKKRRGPGQSGQSVGTQLSPDDSEEEPDDNPLPTPDEDEENRVEGHVWSVAASPPPPASSTAPATTRSWLSTKDD